MESNRPDEPAPSPAPSSKPRPAEDGADPGGGKHGPFQALDDVKAPAVLFAGVTAVLGAVAASGVLATIQREFPYWLLAGMWLVLLAGAAWAAGKVLTKARDRSGLAVIVITFIYAIGLGIVLWAAVLTQREAPRPLIEATVKDGRLLEAKIKAGGLHASRHLRVVVSGRPTASDDPSGPPSPTTARLYDAWLGPDSDGRVDFTLSLPIAALEEIRIRTWVVDSAPGKCFIAAREVEAARRNSSDDAGRLEEEALEILRSPDCRGLGGPVCEVAPPNESAGCVTIRLPPSSTAPQVTATWEGNTAVVEVKADGVPVEAGVVNARVYSRSVVIASAQLRPNSQGTVAASVPVPVGSDVSEICVVVAIDRDADEVDPPLMCPPSTPDSASWLRLPTRP